MLSFNPARSAPPRPSPARPRIQLIGTCSRSPARQNEHNWANGVGLAKHCVRFPSIAPTCNGAPTANRPKSTRAGDEDGPLRANSWFAPALQLSDAKIRGRVLGAKFSRRLGIAGRFRRMDLVAERG